MSHQKTKRIQSPIKGKYHSIVSQYNQENQQNMWSSRITQKRKPIFQETPNRSDVSKQNSLRKKIFSKTQKSKQKSQVSHFSRLLQAEQLKNKTYDDSDQQEVNQRNSDEDDQVKSSSIQQDNTLVDVKRQLFPQTPIKRITHENQHLQRGRQFLSSSWRKQLFQDQNSTPKSNHSISTNNVQKTILKFNYNTPIKKSDEKFDFGENNIQNRNIKKSKNEDCKEFANEIERYGQNKIDANSEKKTESVKYDKKDIAKSLRQLHKRMVNKSKVCEKVDDENIILKRQNEQLKKQNILLKQQRSHKINPTFEKYSYEQQSSEKRILNNENIRLKIKMQKARNILKNLVQIGDVDADQNNSIFNIQGTLQKVMRQLDI